MANQIYTGSNGTIYSGSTAIASIRSFSIEETFETVDATTMNVSGVAFRTNKPTFGAWTATVDVYWTTDDAAGDKVEAGGMLKPGPDEVTLHFWPAGDGAAELGYTGTALVTSRSISSSVDGMIEASITVIGTAPLTTENGV